MRIRLWPAVLGLLLFYGLRLHALTALPPFLDESIHAGRAAGILSGNFLGFADQGKLLHPYWLALFNPITAEPWLIRASTLLLPVLGAAGAYAIAVRLAKTRAAGIITLLVLAVSPLPFFFDRLALADTALHPVMTGFVLSTLILWDYRRPRGWAVLASGSLLATAVAAKASAIAIAPLPLVAMVLLPRNWTPRTRALTAVGVYGVAVALWIPTLTAIRLTGETYFTKLGYHTGTSRSVLDILDDTRAVMAILAQYASPWAFGTLVIMMAVAVGARPWQGLTVLAAVAGWIASLLFIGGGVPTTRYLMPIVPSAVALGAASIAALPPRARATYASGVVLVFVWFGAPFIAVAYTTPTSLPLPRGDALEYIMADSAGTALPTIAAVLADHDATTVVGLLSNCDTLAYLTDIAVACPRLDATGANVDALLASVDAARGVGHFAVLERGPTYLPPSLDAQQITEIQRPGGLTSLVVYYLGEG